MSSRQHLSLIAAIAMLTIGAGPQTQPSTQEQIGRVAKPLIEAYLKRVPVYKLKPEDLRQQVAKAVVKSVNVKDGRLLIVVGLP